jgi:cysteine desulfurase / selenocysteine lyase
MLAQPLSPLASNARRPSSLQGADVRADFPGIGNWHYLDTAATAQKPQAVIDATVNAMGRDYATVHRGVYARSADMTLAYEAARRRVAQFIGATSENEIIFTKGATEGINLVAQTHPKGRVLLSQLEHHSNIVPWQLAGYEIDVCPLTADGRIDLNAAEAMLTPAHTMVAFAHVSNVLGGVLDAKRAAKLAHSVGAKLLLDACQSVPHMPVDVAALDCDFFVFSGHKLYGPTGIGVLWGRAEHLDAMPPWQGGGAMIDRVAFEQTTYADPPGRFEAGTPAIIEVLGLHAAIDYVDAIGLDAIHAHEAALVKQCRDALRSINAVTLYGPEDAAGIVSFNVQGVHPHDVGTILDEESVAIRAGHHCCQPLMSYLDVDATARASFGIYNNAADIDALVRGIERVRKLFG